METTDQLFHPIIPDKKIEGDWFGREIPTNIIVGKISVIDTSAVFKQFFSKLPIGLKIGNHVTIRSASLATEENGYIEIGDFTYISNAVIACKSKVLIGNYVFIAGGVTIVDTDFHPINPAYRIADTIALSPAGNKTHRPQFVSEPVIIEDEVWIGFNATILKGVRIGRGAVIQPGSVVLKDVLPNQIVQGNPAKPIGITT
jgi:acetyltransferase-like isoleucine patch superfamily enzyme